MLKENYGTELKLIDFGSSCLESDRPFKYVQSRYYRSPEVILEHPYTHKIDTWSLGCLVVELLCGQPLFPGVNEYDQICRIHDMLGPFPPCLLEQSSKHKVGRMFARGSEDGVLELIPCRGFKPLDKSLSLILGEKQERDGSCCSTDYASFESFVKLLLVYDPEERIDAATALNHAFFTEHRDIGCQTDYSSIDVRNAPSEVYPMFSQRR